jgi:iron complex transport system substrate-binding protein
MNAPKNGSIRITDAIASIRNDSRDVEARRELEAGIAIAKAILDMRQEAGLTQQQVAVAMGTEQTVIARLESGRQIPSMRTLLRFAEATNTELDIRFLEKNKRSRREGSKTMSTNPRNPWSFMNWIGSRRTLLGAAATGAVASSVGNLAAAQESTPAADVPTNGVQPDGSWVFTDDRGVTVTLPKPPKRVFASIFAAGPLWDFGVRPMAVFGYTHAPGSAEWGRVDPDLQNISTGDGMQMDLEALVALAPEIFIDTTWTASVPDQTSSAGPDSYEMVNSIVPIIALSQENPVDVGIARFAELAALLGADIESAEIAEARSTFEAAVEDLTAAAAEKSELSVLFAYVTREAEWLAANPAPWGDLSFYQRLGLNFVPVDAAPGDFWEILGLELANKYPSDIFVNSTREDCLTPEELQADPLFGEHPAIKAGQIGGWDLEFLQSYQGITPAIKNLAALLRASEKIV